MPGSGEKGTGRHHRRFRKRSLFWKEDIENGKSIMQIEFRPIEYGKDYDIVHNPDKYVLFIDGKEIK